MSSDDFLKHFLVNPNAKPATLSPSQAASYLVRLGLDPSLASAPPTHALLRRLMHAHALTIPYDTTANFFPSSWGPASSGPLLPSDGTAAPRPVGTVEGMTCDLSAAHARIVGAGRGAFCFPLNHLFAGLLRAMSFEVSELTARVYIHRLKNPEEVGYAWTLLAHGISFVGCPADADGKRYLVDVGFGGGTPQFPIPLEDGATIDGLPKNEKFRVRNIRLPGWDAPSSLLQSDALVGWIVERWTGTYWTPLYWVDPTSRTEADLEALCWSADPLLSSTPRSQSHRWNISAATAPFRNLLVVTRSLPDGTRRTLLWDRARAHSQRQSTGTATKLRIYSRKEVLSADEDVVELEATEEEVWRACEREFGFKQHPDA